MVTEKQEPSQSVIKTEGGSPDRGIEGNSYEQNGKFGAGHMSGGEIKDGAKVAGESYEAPSNKFEKNYFNAQEINITIHSHDQKPDGVIPSKSDKKPKEKNVWLSRT